MECSECGHKNPKNANFCSKCGKSFNSNEDKNSNDEIKKSLNDVKEIFKH